MDLPRCKQCNGLLRPHVVWFGEALESRVLRQVDSALQNCDLLLVAGTSALVYVSFLGTNEAAAPGLSFISEFDQDLQAAMETYSH